MSMNSTTHQLPTNTVNAAVLLTVAPNGDGDNYYANEARLYGVDSSRLLYSGPDWKNAVLNAAGVAQTLGIEVLMLVGDNHRSFDPAVLENAINSGREEFFAALGVTVEA